MKIIKTTVSLCLFMLLLPVCALKVMAEVNPIKPIDTGKTTQLTLQYLHGEEQISGAPFKMYRVGDITKSGAFRFDERFNGVYDPSDTWDDVAYKMKQEAELDDDDHDPVEPVREGVTDENGTIVFKSEANDRLTTGIYLITGGEIKFSNEDRYYAKPFLVSLPSFVGSNHNGTTDDVWNYDKVEVAPKAVKDTDQYIVRYNDNRSRIGNAEVTGMPFSPPHEETFKLDSDRLYFRSDPLVPYVRQGTSGDEAAKNSFELIYAEPEAEGYNFLGWNIDPDAKNGYSTILFDPDQREYNVYAIWETIDSPVESDTSSNESSENPSDEPIDNPSKNPSNTPSDTVSVNPGSNPSNPDKDNGNIKKDPILPQTGMLWWPVPVLAAIGFALFIFGAIRGRKSRSDKHGRKSTESILLLAGIILVSSAVCLVLYNTWDDMRAGSDVAEERARVIRLLPAPDRETERTENTENTENNLISPVNADEMPVKRIDGTDFSAMLSIPSISLELPVRDQWSYPGLRRSPCRYTGSAYTDDLVICGHNYSAHFGNLKRLSKGSEVVLTAMNGDIFRYKVEEVTELSPTAYGEMTASGYDLTLFTCTIGGSRRVTVRCSMTGYQPHDASVISSEYVLF